MSKLTNKEALQALLEGKKVRSEQWQIHEYTKLNEAGRLIDEQDLPLTVFGIDSTFYLVEDKAELTRSEIEAAFDEVRKEMKMHDMVSAHYNSVVNKMIAKLGL